MRFYSGWGGLFQDADDGVAFAGEVCADVGITKEVGGGDCEEVEFARISFKG